MPAGRPTGAAAPGWWGADVAAALDRWASDALCSAGGACCQRPSRTASSYSVHAPSFRLLAERDRALLKSWRVKAAFGACQVVLS